MNMQKINVKQTLNHSNHHAFSQLATAQNGVLKCAELGLTVLNVQLGCFFLSLEVQSNYITTGLLKKGQAVVYMHINNGADQLSSKAQIGLAGCRVIFAVERQIAVKH